MSKLDNVQPCFLNKLRRNKHTVTVFTTNGVRMTGRIIGFDQFSIILLVDNVPQMIYKHAISTVAPAKPFSWAEEDTRTYSGNGADGKD